jgi:hypothetical protein
VGAGDAADAVVQVEVADTSPAGGAADGVLGCTVAGHITLLSGWNWFTGADPGAIGADAYDFETIVMHELGHALGLGHSGDTGSVMYAYLAPGETRRAATAQDLSVLDSGGVTAPEPLTAAPWRDHQAPAPPAPPVPSDLSQTAVSAPAALPGGSVEGPKAGAGGGLVSRLQLVTVDGTAGGLTGAARFTAAVVQVGLPGVPIPGSDGGPHFVPVFSLAGPVLLQEPVGGSDALPGAAVHLATESPGPLGPSFRDARDANGEGGTPLDGGSEPAEPALPTLDLPAALAGKAWHAAAVDAVFRSLPPWTGGPTRQGTDEGQVDGPVGVNLAAGSPVLFVLLGATWGPRTEETASRRRSGLRHR